MVWAKLPFGMYYPAIPRLPGALATTSTLLDATGEKLAFIGRVAFADGDDSKDIQNLGFLFGSVTKAGGSGLTVSLQDVSLTANPPQPDETQDQTVAIANGNAAFASNTWITTGNLSANRTVARGALLAVVIEYDVGGRQGADAVNIDGMTTVDSGGLNYPVTSHKTASWATNAALPNILLGFSDGTFGTLDGGYLYSNFTAPSFHSGSVADEIGIRFTVPAQVKVDGAWLVVGCANTSSDFDLVLYNDSTVLETVSVDAMTIQGATRRVTYIPFAAEHKLVPGTIYRLVAKPASTNAITLARTFVSTDTHMEALFGGTAVQTTFRADGGAWTDTTTHRQLMGVRVSSVRKTMLPVIGAGGLVT